MPAPAALSLRKRAAILDAAGEMFDRHGYEGASMAAITRAAGTSKSTIYHQFGDKAGLFGAFVERECRSFTDCLAAVPADCDLAQALYDIGSAVLTLLLSRACLTIDRVVTSEARSFPELARAFYSAGVARTIGVLGAWLTRQVESGLLRIEDTEFAAEQFVMLCQARVVMRRRLCIADNEASGSIEHVVRQAVGVFLRAHR